MKILATLLTTFIIAACGGQDDVSAARADGSSGSAVTMCECANEPLTTDARVNACNQLIASKTPEEVTLETMACNKVLEAPDDGPDLCFCLKTISEDPAIMAACEAILPDDMSPREISAKLVACSR